MASGLTHYPVVLAIHYGGGNRDHHGIYIGIQEGRLGRGYLFHVTGSMQNGMTFQMREDKDPAYSATCKSTQQIAWVSHDNFGEIKSIGETVPPWHGAKRLVPLNQVRDCLDWAAEFVCALWEKGILEPLGPDDNGNVMPTVQGK